MYILALFLILFVLGLVLTAGPFLWAERHPTDDDDDTIGPDGYSIKP